MGDKQSVVPVGRWRRHVLHAAAFLSLWLLFDLPLAIRPDRVDVGVVRPTVEVLLLLSAVVLVAGVRRGRRLWVTALVVLAVALVVVRLDYIIFFFLMRSPPLLYDQLLMLRHLFVLLQDLWGWEMALGLGGAVLGLALAVWGARRLCRVLASAGEPPYRRPTVAALGGLWIALGALALSPWEGAVQWLTPSLLDNVGRSIHTYRATTQRFEASPYAAYDRLALRERPDVYLFLVESYGRVLRTPAMLPTWRALLQDFEGRLAAQGYSAVSAYSTSPVSGGRSWVAEGNILTGLRYEFQPEHQHIVTQLDRVPNLVRFLNRQGYQTALLAPVDRSRPGVEDINYYGYDRKLGFHELRWSGPWFGWGRIPDEYSLQRAHELVIAKARKPLFLNFHMVSSHAPWKETPPLHPDWRALARQAYRERMERRAHPPPVKRARTPPSDAEKVWRRMRSYVRRSSPKREGALDQALGGRYLRAIRYVLGTLREYILEHDPNGLIVIMGDHQPPLVSPEGASFDVPVHFIAKDPALLHEAERAGFEPGLMPSAPPPGVSAKIQHAGLFSLVVRSLARVGAEPDRLPPLRAAGVPLVPPPARPPDARLVVRGPR